MSNIKENNNDDSIVGAIIGIIIAIFLGLLGVALLDALTKSNCPNCGNEIDKNASHCEKCHTILRWQ